MNNAVNRTKGRWQLILLATVFFGPLIVAIAMYFGGSVKPTDDGQVNYGTLIAPPLSIDAKLHFDTGTRGRWTLLYKTSGPCADACEKALFDIRQIRLATGREIDRIERMLIIPAANADLTNILEAHPGLITDSGLGAIGAALADALTALPAEHIYIVDPLGNVMMRYDLQPDRKKLLGDLKKLLKFSRIG